MKRKTAGRWRALLVYGGVALILAVVCLPYFWMVSGSFKTTLELQAADVSRPGMEPTWIPRAPTLRNYLQVNATVPMFRYFQHSFLISVGTMAVSTVLALFAAYARSRFAFPGRSLYSVLLLATQMLPGILFLIPYYLIFALINRVFGLQLRDTYPGMILTYTAFSLPFAVLMLTSYLNGIPAELDEQAQIDGCTKVEALFRVILPLAMPGIAAVAIYSFIMGWNEILFASVLTGDKTKTVAVGIMDYVTATRANWGGMMAACILVSLPVLVLFSFMQRYIVEGLVAGATKG